MLLQLAQMSVETKNDWLLVRMVSVKMADPANEKCASAKQTRGAAQVAKTSATSATLLLSGAYSHDAA